MNKVLRYYVNGSRQLVNYEKNSFAQSRAQLCLAFLGIADDQRVDEVVLARDLRR